MRARSGQLRQRRREAEQRLHEDIGEDEIEWPAFSKDTHNKPVRAHQRNRRAHAIEARILAAVLTATASMSLASTRCRSARAAAIASTALPVPTSRIRLGREVLAIASSAMRQPRVVP